MRFDPFFQRLLFVLISGSVLGCGAPKSANNGNSTPIAIAQGPAEETYCSGTTVYSSPITISGKATYQAREPFGIKGAGGLGAAGAQKPIRHAEVMVKNSAGTVVQCTATDANGDYSLNLPNDGQSYRVIVNSRANNAFINAAVLNRPDINQHYSLESVITANGNQTLNLNASATTGEILGGAFNIFDQMVATNIYLRGETSEAATNCATAFTGCVDVTTPPKVFAYWMKGVNPGIYLNSTSALSFYLPGYRRLFILGGLNGNIDNADTDHFDNSVIIHEYGHFLEDALIASDSPGGAHNGDQIIDPRLAWSEGFANFLQAAVLNHPFYEDTKGNIDGVTDFIFKLNVENGTNDLGSVAGEGHFREFAITRFLFDAVDTGVDLRNGATDNISGRFKELWAVLTKATAGLRQANLKFRNIGNFNVFQDSMGGRTDLSTLRTMERHVASTAHYAQYVTATGASCDQSLTPFDEMADNGSFATSNLFRNNDFYRLDISSTQNVHLTLEYEDADLAGQKADVDLYLYNESARFGVSADMIGKSELEPNSNPATQETESISRSVPAGTYLINVKVFTGGAVGGTFNYRLKLNGVTLCPTNLP